MLRNKINNLHKGVDAMYKASVDLQRGMGVVKSSNYLARFISAAGYKGIYIVDKEPIDSGIWAAMEIRPDYSTTYETVSAGECCVLVPYVKGEQFATDQVSGTLEAGDYVQWGTDGLAVATEDETPFICRGTELDSGKTTLHIIEVVQ